MPLTPQQIEVAQARQRLAAHDTRQQVRLLAGPGSGKTSTIEERVRWLLSNGVPPDGIYVVSFTRASSLDLRRRIVKHCLRSGQEGGELVSVTTLHSLALSALRAGGFIEGVYPTSPLVLDKWELKEIFDREFKCTSGYTLGRCELIRGNHEAFWSTESWNPPNYIQPKPPVTKEERERFSSFHQPRTQTYACVLPGEIVRMCMERIEAGLLDPRTLLQMQHLIVDEFQDLNPVDLGFIHSIIDQGVSVFVGGDDDQSIYSFRFASPAGIQTFPSRYPNSGQHELQECFRCTPQVLGTAMALIRAYPLPDRIPKNFSSLWDDAEPPVMGVVHRWRFSSDVGEARSIAKSCQDLISQGVPPREILILLGNSRRLLSPLKNTFDQIEGVDFEPPHADTYIKTASGRFVLGLIRLVCETDDYVAYRIILGQRPGVGDATCNNVANLVIQNNLNYRDIFRLPLPDGVFSGRALSAINHVRDVCALISDWQPGDALEQRAEDIANIIYDLYGVEDVDNWRSQIEHLPSGMSLEEFRNYLWADTDEQQVSLLTSVYERLGLDVPDAGVLPPRVRAMTMHGAKGLNASVVFIPGLEEGILPNSYQRRASGLILEAARLLYVSITRARVACILSYSTGRVVHGEYVEPTPSRFNKCLAGRFFPRDSGLSQEEVSEIIENRADYLGN